MTLTKYERVVGVVVEPAGICTLEGLSALNGITVMLPSMTTLYEATEVDAELAALRQQLAQVIVERDVAETRNENYRLKLHASEYVIARLSEELAEDQAEITRLQERA